MKNSILPEHKERLDVETSKRGLARSRSSAQNLIRQGFISVNKKIIIKTDFLVGKDDEITATQKEKFVSRAGEKLLRAITAFDIKIKDTTVVDIGSSTGGFVDCVLQNGASKIIAIDVGTDQIDKSLKNNPAIEIYENTDVRKFKLPTPLSNISNVDLVTVDVSFISASLVLPKAFEFLKKGGQAIVLVKPQFEVGRDMAKKVRGVVKEEIDQKSSIDKIKESAKSLSFKILGEVDSPIIGEKGNKEFFLLLQK